MSDPVTPAGPGEPGERSAVAAAPAPAPQAAEPPLVIRDDADFARVYREVAPRLLRYARVLVGQDAEDVAAEAWLHIARDLTQFSGTEDAFRAWSARILRNRAMDHLRARARRPMHPTPIEDFFDLPAADNTADAALEKLSTADAIELISTLPRDQAEAVLLRAVVGLDAASVGTVMDKSAGAVRVAAHRGLRTLAKQLRARSAEDEQRGRR